MHRLKYFMSGLNQSIKVCCAIPGDLRDFFKSNSCMVGGHVENVDPDLQNHLKNEIISSYLLE